VKLPRRIPRGHWHSRVTGSAQGGLELATRRRPAANHVLAQGSRGAQTISGVAGRLLRPVPTTLLPAEDYSKIIRALTT
jgi:hypothetical protein